MSMICWIDFSECVCFIAVLFNLFIFIKPSSVSYEICMQAILFVYGRFIHSLSMVFLYSVTGLFTVFRHIEIKFSSCLGINLWSYLLKRPLWKLNSNMIDTNFCIRTAYSPDVSFEMHWSVFLRALNFPPYKLRSCHLPSVEVSQCKCMLGQTQHSFTFSTQHKRPYCTFFGRGYSQAIASMGKLERT